MAGDMTFDADERAARLARYYDLDTLDVSYDAEFYVELAHEAGGDVLELAVGTGRLGIPLALAGHRVLGIDTDAAMLARARHIWDATRGDIEPGRFEVGEGDFYSYRASRRFSLVFLGVNTFLLAETDESRLALLATMRAHLERGGVAAVEMVTPDAETLATYDGRLQHEWVRQDLDTGEEVTKSISARHDVEAGTVSLTQIYEWTPPHGGPLARATHTDLLHMISAEHLAELASQTGFAVVDLKGDHLATSYGARSHRVILVSRLV